MNKMLLIAGVALLLLAVVVIAVQNVSLDGMMSSGMDQGMVLSSKEMAKMMQHSNMTQMHQAMHGSSSMGCH